MKDVEKLKRDKADLVTRMKALCDTAQKRDDSRMTEQEGLDYLKMEKEKDALTGQIELAERSNALDMETAANAEKNEDDENRGAPGTEKGFESLGEMLLAVRNAEVGRFADPRLTRAATGMGKDVPSDGGYMIQANHMEGLQRKIFEKSLLASKCQKINVGPNSNRLTWNELDETSRANGSRHGGVRAYWGAEAGTVTASSPKLTKRSLELEKLMALVYATDELLEDSSAIDSLITELVSDELSFQLDDSIFNGSGSGLPLGINNSNCMITVAKETGQTADTIVYENIVKMRSRLWARSRGNSIWYINQDIEPELQTMALVVGTGGVPVYMPAAGLAGSPYDTLFGRPVIPTEHNATLGDKGDIILADMSQYRLIDKGGIKKSSSIHVRFLYDEQVFKFTYRVNGAPLWSTVLTPFKGTNTQAPFINLAARA